MSDADRAGVTADEEAIEKRYNEVLSERSKSTQKLTNQMTANTWTTSTSVDIPREGELIGRVALAGSSDLLDGARDFYIGTAKCNAGDFQVYNWAAPIACTYFRKSSSHHQLCNDVVGVRVLAHRGGRIADYQDELVSDSPIGDLFEKRQLLVPRAPGSRPAVPVAPIPERAVYDLENMSAERPEQPGPAGPKSVFTTPQPVRKLPRGPISAAIPGPALRAPELLRRQLAAPKTVTMSAVLATLQSDQYEAITKAASESQILQGHPGTGKTIIAAHRAAYLLNPDAPSEARPTGHVLILGPTTEYVEHVEGALQKLIADERTYEVRAIPSLLEDLAGLPNSAVPTESVLWEDVSPELAGFVDLAYTKARAQLDGAGEKPTSADVYAELVWLLNDPPDDGLQPDWVRYLRDLPQTYDLLKRRKISSYRGLMAYIGARTTRMRNPGHVIVDEAQDIHPIEWQVLGRLGNAGGWTILGDLNQRRTDHTFSSWDQVAEVLAIEGDDGEAPLQVLERGYRSTAQIIKFANQLLPARDRALFSLQQDGEAPKVTRVSTTKDVHELTFASAETLLRRVAPGTVAIITVDLRAMRAVLTRRGWSTAMGDPFTWRHAGMVLKLLPPERARGLEYDGVVVAEPAEFPENVGRQGVLYTALTRANRLLTVVHHQALPRTMKAQP